MDRKVLTWLIGGVAVAAGTVIGYFANKYISDKKITKQISALRPKQTMAPAEAGEIILDTFKDLGEWDENTLSWTNDMELHVWDCVEGKDQPTYTTKYFYDGENGGHMEVNLYLYNGGCVVKKDNSDLVRWLAIDMMSMFQYYHAVGMEELKDSRDRSEDIEKAFSHVTSSMLSYFYTKQVQEMFPDKYAKVLEIASNNLKVIQENYAEEILEGCTKVFGAIIGDGGEVEI